ncbi:hypothetical protein Btru_023562 [Bulinus truncatus]|nr:hypothetical protein Btru_023562 [Bulinus truncatus]
MTPMWLLITAHLIVMTSGVTGNGRLWEPPGRSTMWRRGFNTPVNNNDDQVFCGELGHQQSLGYKCGVCGDPYDGERLNEEGGLYATGLISRSYQQGQLVSIQVEVTTSRYGWFDFRLCPKSSSDEKTTQECLDQYLLPIDGGLGTKYLLPRLFTGLVDVNVRLPPGLTCDYCVLQWTYHIGGAKTLMRQGV